MNQSAQQAKIRIWVRVLALVFVVAALFVFYGVVTQALAHGARAAFSSLGGVGMALATLYLTLLFGHVAIFGTHPVKLFPMATLKWPYCRHPTDHSSGRLRRR